jgi:hypothetical protein
MRLLLTGAGFTRNWGGWVADEAFEYLIGCPEVTPHMRNLLWKHKNADTGFEGVLQKLRDDYLEATKIEPVPVEAARELQTFDHMLIRMFDIMNGGFGDFEPGRHQQAGPQPTPVRDFLCKFDAIFTLNQDTLLEQKYRSSNLIDGSNGRWIGFLSPGIGERTSEDTQSGFQRTGVFRPLEAPYDTQERIQPYYKLHGSSDWRYGASNLLIMGDQKGTQIERIPLLDWYRQQFREMLSRPDARLMIIGYGFRDQHINEILLHAAKNGTKFFIIDFHGVDALKRALPTSDVRDLQQQLQGKELVSEICTGR